MDNSNTFQPLSRSKKRAFFRSLKPGDSVYVLPSTADEGSVVKTGIVVAFPVHPNTWFYVKVGTRVLKKRLSCMAPVADDDALSVPMPRPPGVLPIRPAEESAGSAMVGGSGQDDRRPDRPPLVGKLTLFFNYYCTYSSNIPIRPDISILPLSTLLSSPNAEGTFFPSWRKTAVSCHPATRASLTPLVSL